MVPVELPQGFSTVFYRCFEGCKTIHVSIFRNFMKYSKNKGDIKGLQ